MSIFTTLTLGDFVFKEHEIPERMPFGGAQALAVRRLVGGRRLIDAMGPDHAPLEWSGAFIGQDAESRARYLDQLRIDGVRLVLTWSEFRYTVVIQTFRAEYRFKTHIPYQIVCEVVSYDSQPVTQLDTQSVDEFIAQDLTTVTTLSDSVGDATLTAKVGALQSAISGVTSFAKATQAQIAAVMTPIAEVRSQVSTLIASASNTLNSVATLGGVLPNNPIAKQAARLTEQAASMSQSATLVQLDAVMGRLSSNVGATSAQSRDVAVAGANLYKVAGEAYGDPTEWSTIAKANGLSDPVISDARVIKVPLLPSGSGGVMNG